MRRHIADAKVLTVLDGIIDSSGGRGLPIGNLTSQFFANLYLHEMDLFVKQTLRERYYIRYMDDFLVFSNDKPALHAVRNTLRAFLRDRLRLVLHEGKSQIYDGSCGLKFLGFRIYHDHRRLATAGVRRFRARLKRFRSLLGTGQVAPEHAADSVCSWRAHSLHADTVRLRQRLAEEARPWSEALSSVLLPKLRPPQPRRLGRLLAATMVFVVFCSCPAWAIGFGGGDGRGEASVLLGSRALMQIQSAAEQAFTYGDAATAASSVTVTQEFSAGDGVATVTGIRIRVPAGLGMTWDDSILTATVTGDAAAKVSASAPAVTVSYEDSAKTLVVPVITNFSDGDVVVLSGLKFADFTMSGSDNLLLEIDNAGTVIERDLFWKKINMTERASGFGGSSGRGEGQAAIDHHPPHGLSFGAPF